MLAVELERDLKWREAELAMLKALVAKSDRTSGRRRSLLRCYLAMLYAHYEGFVKFAFEAYLIAVSRTGATYGNLNPILRLRFIQDDVRALKNCVPRQTVSLARALVSRLSERVGSEYEAPETSNLWPEVLDRMCKSHGIGDFPVSHYERRLKQLVARRNDIAHGKGVPVTDRTIDDLEESVWSVCIHVAVELVESYDRHRYWGI